MACCSNPAVLLALACIFLASACQSNTKVATRPFDNHVEGPQIGEQANSVGQQGVNPSSNRESRWLASGAGGDGSVSRPLEQCVPLWGEPVEAEIVDHFRRPDNQYSAGNRGIEFGTVGGEPVVAVQSGEIVFAGPVGGDRFVVVRHVDGLKLTYSYLVDKEVVAGETVSRGDLLGRASTGFHLTVRKSGRYLDPEPFLEQCASSVRLVPLGDK